MLQIKAVRSNPAFLLLSGYLESNNSVQLTAAPNVAELVVAGLL